MQSPAAVMLLNVRAESIVLSADEWEYALMLAESCGWQRKGTRKPPVRLDEAPAPAWDGRYSPASGQEVGAADAGAFGKMLGAAQTQRFQAAIEKLSRFALNGGFLVCPLSTHNSSDLIAFSGAVGGRTRVQTHHQSGWSVEELSAVADETKTDLSIRVR